MGLLPVISRPGGGSAANSRIYSSNSPLPQYEQYSPSKKHTRTRSRRAGLRSWIERNSDGGFSVSKKQGWLVVGLLFLTFLFFSSRPQDGGGAARWKPFTSDSSKESGSEASTIIEFYDLNDYSAHSDGFDKNDIVLICIPLRNASPVLPMMFSHLRNLTYPHKQIDIAFLVSDSDDSTSSDLQTHINLLKIDAAKDTGAGLGFRDITVYERDFGAVIGQGFEARHGVQVQGARRKLMGRARNWLLSSALKPDHSWVYWRDADIEISPPSIIEDLMRHNRDVIVPNVWRPLPEWLGSEQPYDLNSWQESDAARELATTLDEDEVIVEGYAEYPTWRPHLAYFREPDGDPNLMIDLDGIGGVSILAKAKVFRSGANFPGFAFLNHAETEAFGLMCRKMGFSVGGLVHYTVWHMYEPSDEDLKKMKEMAAEAETKKAQQKVDQEFSNNNDDADSF